MRHNPRPQEIYRHFKGNLYQIRCLARNSETMEWMVVYQAMYDTFEIYVRPLSMFMDEVDHVKYPDASQTYRFEMVEDLKELSSSEVSRVTDDTKQPDRAAFACSEDDMSSAHDAEEEEAADLDPMLMDFLNADTYEKKLDILTSLHYRITDEMIDMMAFSNDLVIREGDLESRYEELKNCLLTFEKFECNRLR